MAIKKVKKVKKVKRSHLGERILEELQDQGKRLRNLERRIPKKKKKKGSGDGGLFGFLEEEEE
jgi:hypothetical protein